MTQWLDLYLSNYSKYRDISMHFLLIKGSTKKILPEHHEQSTGRFKNGCPKFGDPFHPFLIVKIRIFVKLELEIELL